MKIANVHSVENNYLKNNILYYNMKMRLTLFTLSTIGTLSYIYPSWLMKYISFFISIETQTYILIFFSIITFIDNLGLAYDINNIKPVNNQEHISVIGNQAIELQKNKMIIYKLTKLNKQPILKHPNKIKLYDRSFL